MLRTFIAHAALISTERLQTVLDFVYAALTPEEEVVTSIVG